MAQKGIPAFVDKSGRKCRKLTSTWICPREGQEYGSGSAVLDYGQPGQDVFEVSFLTPAAARSAAPGKLIRPGKTTEITDINGRKQGHSAVTDELRRAGFGLGINCGHVRAAFPTVLFRKSSVEYDDTEDKELLQQGLAVSASLNAGVRKSKTEADMLEAAGDTEGRKGSPQEDGGAEQGIEILLRQQRAEISVGQGEDLWEREAVPEAHEYVGNTWTGAEPAKHTSAELAELNQYAADKGIKLYTRKPFDGDAELLKSQIDTVADLREEFKIKEPLQLGWKRMDPDDFGETSSNHQQIWINELCIA